MRWVRDEYAVEFWLIVIIFWSYWKHGWVIDEDSKNSNMVEENGELLFAFADIISVNCYNHMLI